VLVAAAEIESGNAGSEIVPEENVLEKYVDRRIKFLIPEVDDTTRKAATSFLAGRLQEGGTPDEIASDLRKHFDDFPRWRAESIARTEAQTAYNAATALTARAMDSNQLLAHDASDGKDKFTDEECIDRHGKVLTVRQAVRENEDEHTNGTLYFTIIPPGVKVETDSSGHATNLASYDPDTKTIYLSDKIAGDTKIQYIKEVLQVL
jgi:SPP1 gp7 family putative phage head morphogenesis protein